MQNYNNSFDILCNHYTVYLLHIHWITLHPKQPTIFFYAYDDVDLVSNTDSMDSTNRTNGLPATDEPFGVVSMTLSNIAEHSSDRSDGSDVHWSKEK
jgi:hypothetical protein